ncbi:hypothetical protein AB1Y20_019661 [Prymnesium parvum]|uniref:Transmembrane protein 107 n=1 Tax=Prymnesium parvum TaxID=97485 RepID=A0AB34JSY3_PRYPA
MWSAYGNLMENRKQPLTRHSPLLPHILLPRNHTTHPARFDTSAGERARTGALRSVHRSEGDERDRSPMVLFRSRCRTSSLGSSAAACSPAMRLSSAEAVRGVTVITIENTESRLQTVMTVSALLLTFISMMPDTTANEMATVETCPSSFEREAHHILYSIMYTSGVLASLLSAKAFFAALTLYVAFSRNEFHPEDFSSIRAWVDAHGNYFNYGEIALVLGIGTSLIAMGCAYFVNWLDYVDCHLTVLQQVVFLVAIFMSLGLPFLACSIIRNNRHLFQKERPNCYFGEAQKRRSTLRLADTEGSAGI